MSLFSLSPWLPHPYEEIKEGVLPSVIDEGVYASWVRKFLSFEHITTHKITYQSKGNAVNGVILHSAENQTTKNSPEYPLIIFNRGGRGRYGMLNVLTLNNLLIPLVEKGYIVAASNYRGVDGGEGEDEFGGAEVQDILTLAEIAADFPHWDKTNIFLFGWSRGGMMTLLALRHGIGVNACALGAPLVDLTLSVGENNGRREEWLQRVVPDYAESGYQALEARSAPYWLHRLPLTPILLMHGDGDPDVSILHSRQLAQKLAQRNHPHQLIEYPGGNHYLNRQRNDVLSQVDHWFRKYMKK